MSIEAGWYADPTDVSQVRWWDGGQWTTHTQPAPVPEPAPQEAPIPLLEPLAPVVAAPAPHLATVSAQLIDAAPVVEPVPERELVSAGRVETPVTLADRAPETTGRSAEPLIPRATATEVLAEPPPSTRTVVEQRPVRPHGASSAPGTDRFTGGGTQDRWGASSAATTEAGWSTGGTGWDPHAVVSSAHKPKRSVKRTVLLIALVGFLGLGLVFLTTAVAMPAFLNQRARAAAAEQPPVLTHTAPAKLVGRSPVKVTGFNPAAASAAARQSGADWAWAGVYGGSRSYVLYVASDVPSDGVAEAYRAQSDTGIARKIFASANRGLVQASGGTVTLGGVEKYQTSVPGTTWCAPLTMSGRSAAYCMWTDGAEMLQMLRLPSDAPGAANEFDKALSQLYAATSKRS